ncbi:hypothetical protein B0T13DRAFT_515853 [Neurospora crassa]|nr:hypothetical protein B0T13DRAFT_515853 [Neurospora crassa]
MPPSEDCPSPLPKDVASESSTDLARPGAVPSCNSNGQRWRLLQKPQWHRPLPSYHSRRRRLSPASSGHGDREAANRLNDDLELMRAERMVSRQAREDESRRSRSRNRSTENLEDVFDTVAGAGATPTPAVTTVAKTTWLTRTWARLRKFPRVLRYVVYSIPPAILILIPIFLDIFAYNRHQDVGEDRGVRLLWFGICNHKKWRDIGRQLEFPTACFIWLLVVVVTYNPILKDHRIDQGEDARDKDSAWISIVYKIILAFFILATLNFAEKILIQWIASSLSPPDLFPSHSGKFEGDSSGMRTPMRAMKTNARQAWNKVGNAANRFAGDITGRRILKGNHPRKVVMELLRSTNSSYTLARVFYRGSRGLLCHFDKDFNGDISMEELEMVCSEIHLEKKAIAASLKDLDSVIKKLDKVFMFIIIVIVIIVFISIISNSAAAALTSTGTVILGLSWLLQATAQEFLQSILFVFVKHPFDVGDRVTIYGNTGSLMRGDDYYVLEVSLLYTEFKKMEGHVSRSGDPVNLTLRFGTTEAQIEELKARMLDFCIKNQRDYAPRIISEVRTIDEVYSINMNIIFFHKSNFQNELLRLTRHNKFPVAILSLANPVKTDRNNSKQPPQHQFSPPPPSSSPSDFLRRRHRADSRATVVESGVDFQDVYMNRRPEPLGVHGIHRLASIRQRDEEEEEDDHDEKASHRHNDMASELDQRLDKTSSRGTRGDDISAAGRPSRDGSMTASQQTRHNSTHSTNPSNPNPSNPNANNANEARITRLLSASPAFSTIPLFPPLLPFFFVVAFLILHEITAVVPGLGFFYLFHYCGGDDDDKEEDHKDKDKEGSYGKRFEEWVMGWMMELGYSESLGGRGAGVCDTKALLPVRIIASVQATPWFAGVLGRVRRVFGGGLRK